MNSDNVHVVGISYVTYQFYCISVTFVCMSFLLHWHAVMHGTLAAVV